MGHTVQPVSIRIDGWIIAEWLGRWTQQWEAKGVFEILRPAFETGLRPVKQFAHSWN